MVLGLTLFCFGLMGLLSFLYFSLQLVEDMADRLFSLMLSAEHGLLVFGELALLFILGVLLAIINAHGEHEVCYYFSLVKHSIARCIDQMKCLISSMILEIFQGLLFIQHFVSIGVQVKVEHRRFHEFAFVWADKQVNIFRYFGFRPLETVKQEIDLLLHVSTRLVISSSIEYF